MRPSLEQILSLLSASLFSCALFLIPKLCSLNLDLFCSNQDPATANLWTTMKLNAIEESVKNKNVGLSVVHQFRWDSGALWIFSGMLDWLNSCI